MVYILYTNYYILEILLYITNYYILEVTYDCGKFDFAWLEKRGLESASKHPDTKIASA